MVPLALIDKYMLEANKEALFFVGAYSEPGPYFEANGEGLYSFALDLETGFVRELAVNQKIVNATYMAKQEQGNHLYVASDLYFSPGKIIACEIDNISGEVMACCSQSCLGQATCHIALNSSADQAFVSSYLDARVTQHTLDGATVSPHSHLLEYSGKSDGEGANPERQEAAHAHQAVISPGGRWLCVVDLGNDKIWVHDLQSLDKEPKYLSISSGAGPRHLIFHPSLPIVYLFCELNARLITCSFDEITGGLRIQSEQETLPADFSGVPAGAAIHLHPSNKALYVSNRNSHSVTVFTVGVNGELTCASKFSSGGGDPRDFGIDRTGAWLVSANQNTNNLSSFRLDVSTGLPIDAKPVHNYSCGSPVCVLFY